MIRKRKEILFLALAVFVLLGGSVFADDIVDQKQELERIKKQIEDSQRALDSLQNVEKKVRKEIANYEQQASANQTVLKRLNNQLSQIRQNLNKAESALGQSEDRYQGAHSRYVSNLNFYYMGTRTGTNGYTTELEQEKSTFRKMVYLKSLAAYDREDLSESSEILDQAESDYEELVGREREVGSAQKKKKSEYVILSSQKDSRERDLSKLRRTKERETDRYLTLSEAARQMEDLIARLEQNRIEREAGSAPADFEYATGNFDTYKGGMPAPIKGTITVSFGWKRDKITNLKSFSPGIEINGKVNGAVGVVARGVIAYIGFMRGYGKFLIVEHEDGYFSTYAGLDKLFVGQNQIVNGGDILGNTETGLVKFELRRGREALDPMEWLKIDSFK